MDGEGKPKRRRTGAVTKIDGPKAFTFKEAESQIELVLVHVNPEAAPTGPWRTLEFWTGNTMYGLDSNLICIETSSRNPHRPTAPVHLIGTRLIGSQCRDGDEFSVSFPYPVPGMEAVFQLGEGEKFINTSKVERVMLRVRMTNLTMGANQSPDWSKITTQWKRSD